jgi:hypothetical protein
MIGMMVGQDQPPDPLGRDRPDGAYQLLPLERARERVDHHDTFTGDDESRVGASLRASPRIAENHVDSGSYLAEGRTFGELREELKQQEGR